VVAWLLGLIEFIAALYVLLLGVRHPANRHVSALLMVYAIISFSTGLLSGAENATQAALPTRLLAATVLGVHPGMLVTSVALLRPHWLSARWRAVWWLVYGLALLPAALTSADLWLGTELWYTGPDVEAYRGGLVSLSEAAQGSLATVLRWGLYGMSAPTVLVLLYVGWRAEGTWRTDRRLAQMLLGVEGLALATHVGFGGGVSSLPILLVTNVVSTAAYGYAALEPVLAGRRPQQGRLRFRLTALILAIALPILLAVAGWMYVEMGAYVDQVVAGQMRAAHQVLSTHVSSWLESSTALLERTVSSPEIAAMDAERQELHLKAVAEASPSVHLIAAVGLDGRSIARSDGLRGGEDYGDQVWFEQVKEGSSRVLQPVIGEASGGPMLVQSMPIRDASGSLIGVAMMSSSFEDIVRQVQATQWGEGGFSYVVDASGRAVAHPDPLLSNELRSLADHPPVAAYLQGQRGLMSFADEGGQAWRAYVDALDGGWGVVVQWRAGRPLSVVVPLWRGLFSTLVVGACLLAGLTFLAVRHALRPIATLTETAVAIADGDLARVAGVEGGDEVGALARAFDRMTAQLRESIGSLERVVAHRTRQLERHSSYLEASSQVASAVASILEPERLMRVVVDLICERFDLHYVGLFLVDEEREWAVLRAGTGDSGRMMLEQGHRLPIGEGVVGWCIANAQPRIAQGAEVEDWGPAASELPATRSEVGLPLRARGQVLGALAVQSHRAGAFDEDAVSLLQSLADQVAVALENARLFVESQEALAAAQRAYGQPSRQAWDDLLPRRGAWGYRYVRGAVWPLARQETDEMVQSVQEPRSGRWPDGDGPELTVPLRVRDRRVGLLRLCKDRTDREWTPQEAELLETLSYQLGAVLEDALFFQTAQSQAAEEELIAEFSTRVRETLDVESVIRTAVQEVRQALGLPEVVIRLAPEPGAETWDGSGPGA
jgi:GAF domain-containing protein/HAMP domain-containing protein